MRKAELRSAAVALGVFKESNKDCETLRAMCKAAVVSQGTLLRYAVACAPTCTPPPRSQRKLATAGLPPAIPTCMSPFSRQALLLVLRRPGHE